VDEVPDGLDEDEQGDDLRVVGDFGGLAVGVGAGGDENEGDGGEGDEEQAVEDVADEGDEEYLPEQGVHARVVQPREADEGQLGDAVGDVFAWEGGEGEEMPDDEGDAEADEKALDEGDLEGREEGASLFQQDDQAVEKLVELLAVHGVLRSMAAMNSGSVRTISPSSK